jgi:hypothetical protein
LSSAWQCMCIQRITTTYSDTCSMHYMYHEYVYTKNFIPRNYIEWATPGMHNPVIQIWLKLYCLEGVNVESVPVRDDACLQNSIECCCTPGSWRVRSGWHIKLHSIVVCNPLSQYLGKKLQHEMASTGHILNRRMLSWWVGSLVLIRWEIAASGE